MKIKVTEANADKIETALSEVNGKATVHTFTSFKEISEIAEIAEKSCYILNTANKKGAKFCALSGKPVAKSYNRVRIGTHVILERGSKDWFLVNISNATLYRSNGGEQELVLTKEQDNHVVENFRKKYKVQ